MGYFRVDRQIKSSLMGLIWQTHKLLHDTDKNTVAFMHLPRALYVQSFCPHSHDVMWRHDVMLWCYTTWYTMLVGGTQCRWMVHNAGRWCTMYLCTIEVVHNMIIGSKNIHTQTRLILLPQPLTWEVKSDCVKLNKHNICIMLEGTFSSWH